MIENPGTVVVLDVEEEPFADLDQVGETDGELLDVDVLVLQH